jgi:helix-turn-helix protein
MFPFALLNIHFTNLISKHNLFVLRKHKQKFQTKISIIQDGDPFVITQVMGMDDHKVFEKIERVVV